jgi:hypothetical protein
MTWLLKTRSAAIWLLLVIVTLFSWESVVMEGNRKVAASVVLLLAFFKVRMIGIEFMELKIAPLPLRIAFEVWILGICAVLLTLVWQAPPA